MLEKQPDSSEEEASEGLRRRAVAEEKEMRGEATHTHTHTLNQTDCLRL